MSTGTSQEVQLAPMTQVRAKILTLSDHSSSVCILQSDLTTQVAIASVRIVEHSQYDGQE
jgi:hypothetical protein